MSVHACTTVVAAVLLLLHAPVAAGGATLIFDVELIEIDSGEDEYADPEDGDEEL